MSSGEERGVGYAIGQSEDCLGTRTSPRNKMRFFALNVVAEMVGIVMVRERRALRSFIVDSEGGAAALFVGGRSVLYPRE